MITARHKTLVLVALALLAACGSTPDSAVPHALSTSDGSAPAPTLATFATEAVDEDTAIASAAIEALRAAGPAGLAALLEAHAAEVTTLREAPLVADRAALDALREDPALARLRVAIDRVAAQRDAFASGLYWYTDLAEAQIESARTNRPILSLRLLGRLDEEASCANSRFFRWLLYPNPAVREALAGYVLHWSSERPAPHITIDMGDGRTIERTITGNSIHYVLDASGNVIDAIAGLHTAGDFIVRLQAAHALAERCGTRLADRACVASAHIGLSEQTRSAWQAMEGRPGIPSWEELLTRDAPVVDAPSMELAMPITASKMFIEAPMVRMMGATPPPPAIVWDPIARLSVRATYEETISEPSRSLARLKTGRIDDAAMLVATYERARTDTALNRFTLERRLHAWLEDPREPADFASINTRVYAELFLTPASDPWLGLRSETDWDVLEVTSSSDSEN